MIVVKISTGALVIALLGLFSCGPKQKESIPQTIEVPRFHADSSYAYIKKQVDFGPRVPGSSPHQQAKEFLVSELKQRGAQVVVQSFRAVTYDGVNVELSNIIASFQPEKQKRVLLAAHWDTRPFADKDKTRKDAPMDGANDGASGVGVLLEIARALQSKPTNVGIDIILFDGEDWGEKIDSPDVPLAEGLADWWCLGSQYWSKNKHKAGYSAYYGILLDMVGAQDAHFYREGGSMEYAPRIVDKVWSAAARIGHSRYFVSQDAPGAITDDHVFINKVARIPTIDIVHYDARVGYFGEAHHTTNDNIELISKETLMAVGSTVMDVIYREP
jgi:glutaminyl-peptide cyclotransferase